MQAALCSTAQLQWLSLEVFTEVLQSALGPPLLFHAHGPPEVQLLLALKGPERLQGLCCLRWAHFVSEAAEQKEAAKEFSEPQAAAPLWKLCVLVYSHARSQNSSAAEDRRSGPCGCSPDAAEGL